MAGQGQSQLDPFGQVLRALLRGRVRFVLIGGLAAVLHGVPRATFDLDIFVGRKGGERALRIVEGLKFFPSPVDRPPTGAVKQRHQLYVHASGAVVDVWFKPRGADFESLWNRRSRVRIGGLLLPVASPRDLVRLKRATGRPKDMEDALFLGRRGTGRRGGSP